MSTLVLAPAEARVLSALVEKSVTTPQYYPMTVNAIMLAANQKTSRWPVMNLTEGETGAALNRLEQEKLCTRDDRLGRVPKWKHQFHNYLLVERPVLAVLTTLMLRGPQTLSELRANASGLGGPAETEDVARELQQLADRAQPLVVWLPRASGQKEARCAHTLCGPPEMPVPAADEPAMISVGPTLAALEERIRALEARVAALEQRP